MERLRFITAASLFDGHDVSINIMRRMLQAKGAEVIHLGHNRSAGDVVNAAIQEDAHAVALSSYQGGHCEYFSYVRQLLDQAGANKIKIFGGGGGVITPKEIDQLHAKGITRIYTPHDGATLGLQGIIDDMMDKARFSTIDDLDIKSLKPDKLSDIELAKIISFIENKREVPIKYKAGTVPVLGVTGTGGAGKSSLIDEILLRFGHHYKDKKIALISVDPTKKKTQGALLGDRIRLACTESENIFVRSLATRSSSSELSPQISHVVDFLKSQPFDLIIVETSGIGQSSDEITKVADKCAYIMTPEYGAQTQLEKIEMLDSADFIVLNKFEKPRSEDALRDIRKQYRRNHNLFAGHKDEPTDEELPIYGTMASKFNDSGVNALFFDIASSLNFDTKHLNSLVKEKKPSSKTTIIPNDKALYLREIASACRQYNNSTEEEYENLKDYEALVNSLKVLPNNKDLKEKLKEVEGKLNKNTLKDIALFDEIIEKYKSDSYTYQVRQKDIDVDTTYQSLSGLNISRVAYPNLDSLAAKYRFIREQNLPGHFPYASGIFPFKNKAESPKRMFAGEGGPSRTNQRFHFVSKDEPSKRLSTAFDSVTLYGEDPHERPDIFGKIGEAGVSIATLDDMEDLFKGFDLASKETSVSMTINGPAPIILAMFMNAAIKQQLSGKDLDNNEKRIEVMRKVRGTVQADVLKEDQAQNTCIFSLEFAIKLMGDVQEYFCQKAIRNYYTVSISGYHIAEAGANPISQVAFTMSNGFTYVEYYLSRGMKIDDFADNLSFFFSNGLDPEYTVIGRVARKIWAVTMREKYGANEKSQRFKYHIQTSGRSLHAQEIDFNDIRTTLQALIALSDNCNSLHTNAYDEAITTPTEESVRRSMAIQMIINQEFGLNQTDNPLQGSYLVEELSHLVEEAILSELETISDKGGVLSAMESTYQRSKIQDESLLYENRKNSGELPIIGVNTHLDPNADKKQQEEIQLSRCTDEEKQAQITRLRKFQERNKKESKEALAKLREVVLNEGNIFAELMQTVNYCSLGEITGELYTLGGKYRRNM